MIFVHFQGKPFRTTVIQVYALTSNAEEVEVEQLYEDLQDVLELTLKKKHHYEQSENGASVVLKVKAEIKAQKRQSGEYSRN